MKSPEFVKVNGTAGLGTNNMKANFDGFVVRSKPDIPNESRKKKKTSPSVEGSSQSSQMNVEPATESKIVDANKKTDDITSIK